MQESLSNKYLPLALVVTTIQNIVLFVLNAVCVIAGLFTSALGLFFLVDEKSVSDNRPIKNLPKWLWIWGNDADGVDGDKRKWWDVNCDKLVFMGLLPWLRSKGVAIDVIDSSSYIARWWWCAVRNPANNLRFVPYLSCPVAQTHVSYFGDYQVKDKLGMEGWQLVIAWHKTKKMGWFGFYAVIKYPWSNNGLRVRMGYKVEPSDNESTQTLPKGFAISILPNKDLT